MCRVQLRTIKTNERTQAALTNAVGEDLKRVWWASNDIEGPSSKQQFLKPIDPLPPVFVIYHFDLIFFFLNHIPCLSVCFIP